MAVYINVKGTMQQEFMLGKKGPKIKNNAGALQLRNNADSAYAEIQAATPTTSNSLATKDYVDANIAGDVTDTVTTTDDTQTTLQTITISTGEQRVIIAKIIGNESATGDTIWKKITGCVKNISGTVSIVGGTVSDTGNDAGAATWNIILDVTGATARIRVTGESAHTVVWYTTTEISQETGGLTNTETTTDDTQTTLQIISIPTDEQRIIKASIVGNESATGDTVWKSLVGCVKNISGTVSIIGSTVEDTGYDAGASTWDISLDVTGATARIRVTGESAHTIIWYTTTEATQ